MDLGGNANDYTRRIKTFTTCYWEGRRFLSTLSDILLIPLGNGMSVNPFQFRTQYPILDSFEECLSSGRWLVLGERSAVQV